MDRSRKLQFDPDPWMLKGSVIIAMVLTCSLQSAPSAQIIAITSWPILVLLQILNQYPFAGTPA